MSTLSFQSRATDLFRPADSDRVAVVSRFANAQVQPANLATGKLLFGKHCAVCHRLEGQGNAIGPNLVAISDKSMPAMLTAIMDPNNAIEEKYLNYVLVTSSGIVMHGILLDESATSITLATAEGKQVSILRSEIDALRLTGKSLMPEGFEQVLSAQDVTDIAGYVQSISVPRKRFDGNEPQVAPVRNDGSIRLFAMHAEIYGPSVQFEDKYRNLGFWSDVHDRAVWTIDAAKAGRYEMYLDYACSPQASANQFQIRVNGQTLSDVVTFTSSWDAYQNKRIGTIELPDEPVKLTVQSSGPISGYLFDLRTIFLYPDD